MTFTGFDDEAFEFYEGLAADNSRTYWNAHKAVYERSVRQPMRALLDGLAPAFDAEAVVFRPYRDIRFSRDKSPYKTHQSGFLEVAPGIGYYLQLDAEGLLIGGGFHAHGRAQTQRYRAAVDAPATGQELLAILDALDGYEVGGAQVRTRPRGVPADHPRLDLMRREFLTAGRRVDPATLTVAAAEREWDRIRPLVEWILRHVGAG